MVEKKKNNKIQFFIRNIFFNFFHLKVNKFFITTKFWVQTFKNVVQSVPADAT